MTSEPQSAVGREEVMDFLGEAFRNQRIGFTGADVDDIRGALEALLKRRLALRPSASASTFIDRERAAREIERTELVGGGVADMRALAAAVVRNAALVPGVDPSASAADSLGSWMSAALDDPAVCEAMKTDIRAWFAAGCPIPSASAGGDGRERLVLDAYDAGLLNDFGGGNVEWWQDYIRAELERAHDFYLSQVG